MKINIEMIKEMDTCKDGVLWFLVKYTNDIDLNTLAKDLITEDKEPWLNWFITKKMNKENRVKYAIFAAEQVLHIYENKYPNDDRPRNAIDAAKKYLIAIEKDAADDDAAAYAAAYADAYAAAYADAYAAASAAAAKKETYKKILDYGINLLKEQEKGELK